MIQVNSGCPVLGRICAFVVLLGAAFLLPADARAANTVEHLYEVSLLALDQSDAARQKALREGLASVILRVSGQAEWQGNPAIQEAMAAPDAYLQQFSYVSLTDAEIANIKAKASGSTERSKKDKRLPDALPTIKINVSFTPESVKALLRRAQLPLWPSRRPSVLVWLVIDNGSGKQMLALSSPERTYLLQEAERRGLPVVMPMNDLSDQVGLGVNRLWDLDQAAINEASQRYGEDSILVGRVAQVSPGQWQGNWLYLLKGQSQLVESSADDLEGFLANGITTVIQAQVQRYGISPGSATEKVTLEIAGVNSLKRYADVLALLKNLDMVNAVAVTSVADATLGCTVDIRGDRRLLQDLIGLGDVLGSDDPPSLSPLAAGAVEDQAKALHYHVVTP